MFSKVFFGILNLFSVVPWALESWAGYNIRLFCEDDVMKYKNTEHALCVLNHSGDLDWMVGWCIIDRMGMLGVSQTTPTINYLLY